MQGIYCIKNNINGKEYIGSSINVRKRFLRHFSELKNNKHKNTKLQNSYNKHGKDNFVFSILEEVNEKGALISREQYYIDTMLPEYNINLIANSSLGVKRSEETKEKIKKANLGLKHPSWRNEIKSAAQCGENHWTKVKAFSEDAKNKMSDSQKELYKNGYVHPNKKTILQYSLDMVFIKKWESATEAGRVLDCSNVGICQCAKGIIKTSNKFIWRYEK